MKLAEVYIEHSSLQLDQSFSYLCGHAEVRPGMRVSVPFAKQQLVGFVDSVKEVSADELKQMPYELKEIQRVIDERPLLNWESGWPSSMWRRSSAVIRRCCQAC